MKNNLENLETCYSDCWVAGYLAYRQGLMPKDNPYSVTDSMLRTYWADGWREASCDDDNALDKLDAEIDADIENVIHRAKANTRKFLGRDTL